MYSLNRATILGNVTRDPEMRTTATGQAVCTIGVATNYQWTDAQGQKQERVEFHNIVAWRKLAEIVGQYVRKGSKVYVEGRIQTRDWQDQQGVKRYRTEIIADNLIMLDKKGTGPAGAAPMMAAASPAASAPSEPIIQVEDAPTPTPAPEEEVKIEDVPF